MYRLTTILIITLVASLVHDAQAAGIRRWVDPETGTVTFGDAPRHASAERIHVRPSEGLNVCGEYCQRQALAIEIGDRTAHFLRDPVCRRPYFTNDAAGKEIAMAAKEECARDKALAELGFPSEGVGQAQALWAQHFEREGVRRRRATDRAIYLNEQWQNRAAMDRQTNAIRRQGREQSRALRDAQSKPHDQTRAIERQTDALEQLDRALRRW
jgi:hypothetical protein